MTLLLRAGRPLLSSHGTAALFCVSVAGCMQEHVGEAAAIMEALRPQFQAAIDKANAKKGV